ncbi:hypothetical protein ACVW1A_000362 [Bradyrhizobium sp. LB1.3]
MRAASVAEKYSENVALARYREVISDVRRATTKR